MLAILFAFLLTYGFAIGNVRGRVGTPKVPAPTAAVFTVVSGMVTVAGLALLLSWNDIESLSTEAIGWIVLIEIMAYPGPSAAGHWHFHGGGIQSGCCPGETYGLCACSVRCFDVCL